tara:strand:+ start:361 stop:855 length:495 start_codon:yes stop_codon:yes gene_type:complete
MVETLRLGINGTPSTKEFPNKGPQHASIVLSNIFEIATKEINMLTGNLDATVIKKDFMTALTSFLGKENTVLNIIFTDGTLMNKDIVEQLKKFENVNMFNAPNDMNSKYLSGENFHFTVADKSMFRFETDTDKFKAWCSFNSPNKATSLNNLFEKIKTGAEEKK